jgi:hypothetical protein
LKENRRPPSSPGTASGIGGIRGANRVGYKGLEYETGKALLAFLEEMKGRLRDLQPIGSLAVGVGRAIGDTIESRARELEFPPEEAVDYFFSEMHPRNRRFP